VYPTSTMRMRIHATRCSRFVPFCLRGQSASELEEPPHARVSERGAGAEHRRAGTGDHADVVLPTIGLGLERESTKGPWTHS
jgi:hypothetical protein